MTQQERLQAIAKTKRASTDRVAELVADADACERGARAWEIVERVAALQRIDGTFDVIDLIEQARALVNGVDR